MFGRHTVGLGMWLRNTALNALVIVGLSGCGMATAPAAARRVEPLATASPAQEPAPAVQASLPASVAPSAEPAASASPSAAAANGPTVKPSPPSIRLGPLQYVRQTLNNCGPAAIVEVLGDRKSVV